MLFAIRHLQSLPNLASSPLVGEDGGEGENAPCAWGSFLEQNADSFEKEPIFLKVMLCAITAMVMH